MSEAKEAVKTDKVENNENQAEKEAALDKKIAEIRRKNEERTKRFAVSVFSSVLNNLSTGLY
jgi:hypothetical protein